MKFHQKENSYFEKFENIIQKEKEKNFPLISCFYLLDKRITQKFDSLIKMNNSLKEIINGKLRKIENKLKNIEKTSNNYESLEDKIKNISDNLNNITKELNESKKNISNNYGDLKDKIKNDITKELNENKENKNFYKINQNNFKNKKIKDFISIYKKNELGFKYFEPFDIIEENKEITSSIQKNIYEYYLPEEEDCINKAAGRFLFLVGEISRISASLANKIYSEFFKEYKNYLENNKEWLTFKDEEDRKNLSIWIKKCLDEKKFYEYYSNINIDKIKKYLYKNDNKTSEILFGLFKNLLRLYTMCMLSIPLVKIKFLSNNSQFNPNIMVDFILKKNRIFNFCYLPALESNGKLIEGGKYYVFTFKDKTYKKNNNIFENEFTVQKFKLYLIPNFNELEIKIITNFDFKKKDYKITVETIPQIIPELKPHYYLYKKSSFYFFDDLKISDNDTGNFKLEEQDLKQKFFIKIIDYLNREKKFNFCFNDIK